MSTPRVILRWQDTNNIEIGHKIYRSYTPMDIQNMPRPHMRCLLSKYLSTNSINTPYNYMD